MGGAWVHDCSSLHLYRVRYGSVQQEKDLAGVPDKKPRRAVVQMVQGGLTNGRAETHPNLGMAGL